MALVVLYVDEGRRIIEQGIHQRSVFFLGGGRRLQFEVGGFEIPPECVQLQKPRDLGAHDRRLQRLEQKVRGAGRVAAQNHCHIAVCGGLTAAIQRAKRQTPALTVVDVECDTLDQVREAVSAGAGMILLDNMGVAELKEAVKIAQGRAVLEASGGITLETIREKASSGVNFVSVGRMTQSAPAVDIGLDYGA